MWQSVQGFPIGFGNFKSRLALYLLGFPRTPALECLAMPAAKSLSRKQDFVLSDALLQAFSINDRINFYLIEAIDTKAWDADPPGGKGRSIAAIVAHMHNVRVMWLKAVNKEAKPPEQLDRHSVTPKQAIQALKESGKALTEVIRSAAASDGHVKGFKPDVASFLAYLISHDSHHRGQITMLARQLGYPVPQKVMFGMWEWNSR